MNARSQIATLLKELRTEYANAKSEADRQKIAFIGKSINALLEKHATAAQA